MIQITSRFTTIILIGIAILWVLILGGSGWWLWYKYQRSTKVNATQVKAVGVQLQTEQLEQAAKLMGDQ